LVTSVTTAPAPAPEARARAGAKRIKVHLKIQKTLHPVRQPNVQSNLCTFSQGPSQLCEANNIRIEGRSAGSSLNGSISASLIPPTNKQSEQQYSITYTVYLHCFLSGLSPAQTMKPKSNQQIATNSNHFPTNHKSNDIIGCNQLLHRSSKLAQIALETRQVRIVLHVSQAIQVYAKRHCTDSHYHGCALCIKTLQPIYTECMRAKPSTQRYSNCRTRYPQFVKQHITEHGTYLHAKYCHTSTTTSSKPSTSEAG
jgi:hypothetical protein